MIRKFRVLPLFCLSIALLMGVALFSSCGKEGNASPTGFNTQLNIINLSPDVLPVNLFINQRQQNTRSYIYSVPSGYFYLNTLAMPVQIRTLQNLVIFNNDTAALTTNSKHTIMITGMVTDKTLASIYLSDSSALPTLGRGKVRFVNAAARSANIDVYANGTLAIKNQPILKVSDYMEFPAGIYDFKIAAAGTQSILSEQANTLIQDGRLYTIYTYGISGRTDTAKFASGLIINR